MKKLITTLIIIFISNIVCSQSDTENYIKTTTYKVETQDGDVIDDQKTEIITYHDGLGRVKQTISKQNGGNKEDNIIPITYDLYGRQNIQYLPYARSVSSLNYENPISSGLFSNLNDQYLTNHPEDFNSSIPPNPYSQTVFEKSPLNIVKEKAAAGYDWRYDEDNVTSTTVQVPIPFSFSTEIDPLLFTYPNVDALGQVDIGISNTEINIVFNMIMQESELKLGQIIYLDTAPYELGDYFIGQLKDNTGNLVPYFVEIQNNYLVITSTDPTYRLESIYGTLNLSVNIQSVEFTTYQTETSSNHTIKYDFGTNLTGSNIKHFGVEFVGGTQETELVYLGSYSTNALYKNVIKDENWTPFNNDGRLNTTEEFKDKFGRLILKRTYAKHEVQGVPVSYSQPYDTYYVYDKYGNLTYIIPPLASDAILEMGNQGFRVASQINYPWTDLAEVDKTFAEEYNKKLKEYANENLLNVDLENEYRGQGGFIISTFENTDLVTMSLTFSSTKGITLKQGELISLKEYGEFKDTELGNIKGIDFDYYFIIKENSIVIKKSGKGKGELTSINETFYSSTKLTYSQDYLWTTYSDVDSKFASEFEKAVSDLAKETNQSVLNTIVENQYGAEGGLNISIDENDIITININSSSNEPIKLKQGLVIPLNTKRFIENRALGSISGTGYEYYFAIRENSLFINGSGAITNLNSFFTSPPPPETPTITAGTVGGLCFIYHYDYRNRVMNKKIPGKGWQYIVYDKLDRPILLQDAKMRLNNQWFFTKYDIFGREIYTGIYTYTPTGSETNEQLELQSIIDNQTSPSWFENKTSTAQTINETTVYYSNNSYPITDIDILTINYYDDYNFDNSEIALALPISILGQSISNQVKTLSTGNKTRILGTDHWITSVIYYDDKSRPVYIVNKNEFINTINIKKNKIDFTGNILISEMSHVKDSNVEITKIDNYSYDHNGRLLTQTQSIDGSSSELIISNSYNEFGQITDKKVGGSVASIPENSVGLQTIDYTYNIRGWLKSINNGETMGGDLFGFKISYNDPQNVGVTSLYTGNISETHWKTANDNKPRSYDYRYDALSRIKTANYHGDYQVLSATLDDIEDYSLGNVDYDKNGNILALERTGLVLSGNGIGIHQIDIIDDLTYAYSPLSNKLTSIQDLGSKDGFNNENTSNDDYSYDINGNLTKDLNKEITSIEYNHLNLPSKITQFKILPTIVVENFIDYVYDANGLKIMKKVTENTGAYILTTETIYNEGYIYEKFDGGRPNPNAPDPIFKLKSDNHPGGYIDYNEDGSFDYVYQYKDHLGNVRLTYSDFNNDSSISVSEIKSEQNYYPFGLEHEGYNNLIVGTQNNIKTFQNQELTKDLGLNTHEWKYRVSDPSIGRFWQIDPLAEDYVYNGVYNFSENKVIWAKELEGLESWYTTSGSTNPHDNFLFAPQNGPLTYDYAASQGFSSYSIDSKDIVVRNYNFSNSEVQAMSDWNTLNGESINGDCIACAVRGVEVLTGFDVGWSIGSNPNSLNLQGRSVYDLGAILVNNNLGVEINPTQGGEANAISESITTNNINENAVFLAGPSGGMHSVIVTFSAPNNNYSMFDQGTGWGGTNFSLTTLNTKFTAINDWSAQYFIDGRTRTWGSRLWSLFKNETKTVPVLEQASRWNDYSPSGTGEADDMH